MWTAIAVAVGAVAVFVVVASIHERRRQRTIAAGREPWTAEEFVAVLVDRGVVDDTARFVRARLEPYYCDPLTPQPDDDLLRLIKIDPEDIGDDVMDYADTFGLALPKGRIDLPDPLTASAYALWLDTLRQNADPGRRSG